MAGNPLRTRLCEEVGLEFPICAFTHCLDVVVAVVNAGGLGVFAAGGRGAELSKDIQWIRDRVGNKPFGIDILMPASVPPGTTAASVKEQIPPGHKEFIARIKRENNIPDAKPLPQQQSVGFTPERAREAMNLALSERVPVIASGLGNPAWAVQAAHERGIKMFGLVGNTRQARREAEAGVDFIIAQGYDSGGHTGEIGTFSLVPQVVDAVSPTPVICAGGVGGGRHLAAALCLGAVGVWTGTIWLTARESDTDMIIKQKILDATERDTVRSRCYTGKPVRQLRTRFTEMWEQPGAPEPLPMPLQSMLIGDVWRSVRENQMADWMGSPAGQVVGMIKELKPARQIVFDMVEEASSILDGLTLARSGT